MIGKKEVSNIFKRPESTYEVNSGHPGQKPDPSNPIVNIAGIIPDNSTVLDIGCGSGALGKLLIKTKKNISIDGIEPSRYAAELAKKYYRTMFCGFVHDRLDEIKKTDYDFIVLADVLEHMTDPLEIMSLFSGMISDRTKIIISVPNVAFGAVRLSLLNGDFDYVDSGLLERTHLRFFTLKTIKDTIEKSGMSINELIYLQKNMFLSEIDLKKSRYDLFNVLRLIGDDIASVYQFLLVVSKTKTGTEKVFKGRRTTLLDYLKFLIKGYLKKT